MSSVFTPLSPQKLAEIASRAGKPRVHVLSDRPVRPPASTSVQASAPTSTRPPARAFTAGEKSLIRKVHGYMPALQLLGVLNERLSGDQPGATPYTIEQLHAEIGAVAGATPAGGHDWSSLRKLVAQARRSGVLDAIDRQVVDDFAVVYSLSSNQVLRLQDVLLQAKEGERS